MLVPLKGQSSDADVVKQAALISKKYHASLYLISVVVVKQELALETPQPEEVAHAEQVLENAARIVQEYGIELETGILQARSAGLAIVEEAVARDARLIMMAVTYRSRRGEFNMGRTVPYILKNAPCRVWMFRDELPKTEEE